MLFHNVYDAQTYLAVSLQIVFLVLLTKGDCTKYTGFCDRVSLSTSQKSEIMTLSRV